MIDVAAIVLNAGSELVDVGRIKPHPANPRLGNVDAVATLIAANGFYGHCIVQRSTGWILVGNHRYRAAVQLGMKQVPVEWIDVDDARALAILLSDNRASDESTYDDGLLAQLLQEQASHGTLEATGYSQESLDALLADLATEAEQPAATAPADPAEPASPRGLGAAVIKYTIIFDDEAQQQAWFQFIRSLKAAHPTLNTIGARIIAHLGAKL